MLRCIFTTRQLYPREVVLDATCIALLSFCTLVAAQTVEPTTSRTLAPHATATTRHSEALTVPTGSGTSVNMQITLGTWRLDTSKTQIEIPPQGDYIAELRGGAVVTSIAGNQVSRKSGDIWSVKAGQAMTVSITGKKQHGALLHVFTLLPQ